MGMHHHALRDLVAQRIRLYRLSVRAALVRQRIGCLGSAGRLGDNHGDIVPSASV